MMIGRILAMSAAVAVLASHAVAGDQPGQLTTAETQWGRFSLSTGINYSTGDYGQSEKTDILYVPLTGRVDAGDWVFKLTVPYVSVTGPGNVVQGIGVVGAGATARTTESGLGDVVAAVTRTVFASTDGGTLLDLTGKVKLGTADADRGLGTGENDYSLAIEPAHRLGDYTAFGTLGYKVVGDPDGSDLDNVVFASLGGSTEMRPGTSAGLSLDTQGASSSASPGAQWDVTAFVTSRLDDSWKGQAYVSRGLSDASPDWSGGAMATLTF